MTFEHLCIRAARLAPRAARMAQVTLSGAGPVPLDWLREIKAALDRRASVVLPLPADHITDIARAIGQTPPDWPGWLRADPDFVAAHEWTLDVHLAAESWKDTVLRMLDTGESSAH